VLQIVADFGKSSTIDLLLATHTVNDLMNIGSNI